MMLRRKNRNAQKEQSSGSSKKGSFLGVPGLFGGFGSKRSPNSDPSKSPTSPLDYKLFNLSKPFLRSPCVEGPRRSWDCNRVRLGLTDALLERSGSTGILLGNQIRINISSPNIIPVTHPASPELGSPEFLLGAAGEQTELGKIQSCIADFGRSSLPEREFMYQSSKSSEVLAIEPVPGNVSPEKLIASLSASEIEESEDYTRIITHGPNPTTTHIFGDRILDCHPSELTTLGEKECSVEPSSWFLVRHPEEVPVPSLAHDFLSQCYSCKKKLGSGDDIFMYRGEKAFCSCDCREREILAEKRKAKAASREALNQDKAILATYRLE